MYRTPKAVEWVDRARSLQADGLFEEAERLYSSALSLEPRNADLLFQLAKLHMEWGNAEPAIDCLLEATTADDSDQGPAVYASLGECYLARNDYTAAETWLRRALNTGQDGIADRSTSYRSVCSKLGIALYHQGRAGEALSLLEISARADAPIETHFTFGILLLGAGQSERALAAFARCLSMRPDYAPAHFRYAAALRDLGRMEEAIAAMARGLELEPKNAVAQADLGRMLFAVRRFEEAAEHARAAVEIVPYFQAAYLLQGDALDCLGRTDEAAAAFRAGVRRLTNDLDLNRRTAKLMEREGDFEGALYHYRIAANAHPEACDALQDLGRLLQALDRPLDAIDVLSALVERRPDVAANRFSLGMALMRAGRSLEAIEQFNAVLGLERSVGLDESARELLELAPNRPDHVAPRKSRQAVDPKLPRVRSQALAMKKRAARGRSR